MEGIIELALAVGRLENRVNELEKMLRSSKHEEPKEINPCVATMQEGNTDTESDEMTQDRLIQQGIDNIMGYPWNLTGGGKQWTRK